MIALETKRTKIRNFKASDWQDLHEIIIQFEASQYAIYDHKWPTDAEEIKSIAAWFSSDDYFLAVCLKTTGKLIGYIRLSPTDDRAIKVYEFGYLFNADYHGYGYATESGYTVLDYAFGTLEADAVIAGTAEANTPSRRLLHRLELKENGDQHTVWFDKTSEGEPITFVSLSYVISREDWNARSNATQY